MQNQDALMLAATVLGPSRWTRFDSGGPTWVKVQIMATQNERGETVSRTAEDRFKDSSEQLMTATDSSGQL